MEHTDELLAGMLHVAEDAAPMKAVQAVTGPLAATLDAISVSFLIADVSGRSLVRLAHMPSAYG